MATFTARITEEIGHRDARGEWVATAYRIELRHRSPEVPRRSIVVQANRFHNARWLRMLSPPFVVEPDARDRIVLAVQWLSGWDRPIRKVEAAPRAARQLAGRKGG